MSQIFSVFGVNWEMILAQLFNFGLLLAILWYFLYTPVMKMLDDRQKKIEKGIRDAESAERALSEASDESKRIVSTATKESDDIVRNAKKEAEKQGLHIVADAQKRHDVLLKEAEIKAQEEKRRVLKEAESEMAKLIVLGVEKALTK